MSIYVKVNKLLNDLIDHESFVNVLDIPMINKLAVDPETVASHPQWFDFIDTTAFCNTYVALNPNTKFTSVERNFRLVRENKRRGVSTNNVSLKIA